MGEVQEVPLDIPESAEMLPETTTDIQKVEAEMQESAKETPIVEEEVAQKIKPKAKGRPRGSVNKQPSKPRVKKVVVEEAAIDIVEEEEALPYAPSSPKRNLRIPSDPNASDIAAAMLKLLHEGTNTRQARRERLHRSWFQ